MNKKKQKPTTSGIHGLPGISIGILILWSSSFCMQLPYKKDHYSLEGDFASNQNL